ncbi:DUF6318 family protein [Micrococcus lylae]|uniref:DUF6318 family protein n=1 Tax=Micrococcus lylae TaxID=1273 RepID=UPI000B34F5FE|nr:DUF6318 family protein [Micrococcus lylae]
MRFRASSRGLALSAALLLGLTACTGGDPEEEATSSPTTTAPASASDGTASEGSSSEGSESDGPEEGPAEPSGAGPGEASDATSSDADSTEAGGSGDGGEYVPASEDGPAQNVPKPQMPEEMKEETHEGGTAAVAYWWDTLYYLQQTGDAGPMLEVSSEDCAYCHRYASELEALYAEGQWHTGSKPQVVSSQVGGDNPQKRALALTSLITLGESTHFDENGGIVKDGSTPEFKDDPWYNDVRFNPEKGHWDVTYTAPGGPENE